MLDQEFGNAPGWTLLGQDYFGDSHNEAWEIINKNVKGIQSRTNESWESLNPFSRNCNWYETIYRVNREIFKTSDFKKLSFRKSIVQCKSSKHSLLRDIEESFIKKAALMQSKQFTKEQRSNVDKLLNSEDMKEIIDQMKKSGIQSTEVLRYAVGITYQAIEMGAFNTYILTVKVAAAMNRNLGTRIVMSQATRNVARFAAALNVISWSWLALDICNGLFGPSYARMFQAVLQITQQRFILAMEGIKIEDYYNL
ncbi:hypothetical protein QUF90_04300 [Desulfococcaceae bacterium HSG9]|nr:hypothetical protein [Desulfococcaceae bacterium HSG9]